jgi:hypothetical protein
VSVLEPLTLDPSRTPIEKLLQDGADGYALSELGRERIRAHEQNEEKRADDLIASQKVARKRLTKAHEAYAAAREARLAEIDALITALTETKDVYTEYRAALSAAKQVDVAKEFTRLMDGRTTVFFEGEGTDQRERLLILQSLLTGGAW